MALGSSRPHLLADRLLLLLRHYQEDKPCPKCRLPSIPGTRRYADGVLTEWCPKGHPVRFVELTGPRAPVLAVSGQPGAWEVVVILSDD